MRCIKYHIWNTHLICIWAKREWHAKYLLSLKCFCSSMSFIDVTSCDSPCCWKATLSAAVMLDFEGLSHQMQWHKNKDILCLSSPCTSHPTWILEVRCLAAEEGSSAAVNVHPEEDALPMPLWKWRSSLHFFLWPNRVFDRDLLTPVGYQD